MNGHCDCGPEIEAQVWLWDHKVMLLVLGVLLVVGLAVSGNGL